MLLTSPIQEEAEKVTAAINAFKPPASHELVPKPSRATSEVWKYGVKLRHLTSEKFHFACFGNAKCRAASSKGAFIAVSKGALSNALDHVKGAHHASEYIFFLTGRVPPFITRRE